MLVYVLVLLSVIVNFRSIIKDDFQFEKVKDAFDRTAHFAQSRSSNFSTALNVFLTNHNQYGNNRNDEAHLASKQANRSPVQGKTKPDSFFFIHCPKTGTSLFTVLRNSLDACTEKNFTCFGVYGGGFWGRQMKNNISVYPYDAKIMFGSTITEQETRRINTCNGKLPNCVREVKDPDPYHCPYLDCGEYENKVTMIRNPYKWLPSYAHWMWSDLAPQRKSLETILPFQSQMSFIANTNNVDEAINILQNNYTWWGISDYWETSICTFHCKFGGNTTDIELHNTRPVASEEGFETITLEDLRFKVPTVEELIPNMTKYVEMHYRSDVILYSTLLELLWKRADLCGC